MKRCFINLGGGEMAVQVVKGSSVNLSIALDIDGGGVVGDRCGCACSG